MMKRRYISPESHQTDHTCNGGFIRSHPSLWGKEREGQGEKRKLNEGAVKESLFRCQVGVDGKKFLLALSLLPLISYTFVSFCLI